MEIFKSMDYLIDYRVKERNRTFIINKEELFTALLDIKKHGGEIETIMDEKREIEYSLEELYKEERERIDEQYKYLENSQKVYNTTEIHLKKLLKYEAIFKEEYKRYLKELDMYKKKYKDDLEEFKEKAKKLYLI